MTEVLTLLKATRYLTTIKYRICSDFSFKQFSPLSCFRGKDRINVDFEKLKFQDLGSKKP